jgi:putative endonuclease
MSRGSTAYFNGLAAEEIAAQAYMARGCRILARRWKVPEGEIDLIAEADGVIVFIEVKARKTMATALTALQPKQKARLLACASCYLAAQASLNHACRFDLVAVDSQGCVEIIENVILD